MESMSNQVIVLYLESTSFYISIRGWTWDIWDVYPSGKLTFGIHSLEGVFSVWHWNTATSWMSPIQSPLWTRWWKPCEHWIFPSQLQNPTPIVADFFRDNLDARECKIPSLQPFFFFFFFFFLFFFLLLLLLLLLLSLFQHFQERFSNCFKRICPKNAYLRTSLQDLEVEFRKLDREGTVL